MIKDDVLDDLRVFEDIAYPDSYGHEFYALNDGSYIMREDGKTTLYGEAYMIKDGQQWQICKDGESLSLWLINEQEFDRAQGKYLKARDVAALKAYAMRNSDSNTAPL